MEADQIQALLAELSTEEQQQFEQLLDELKTVKGDLTRLSNDNQSLLAGLAERHMPKAAEVSDSATEQMPVTATEHSVADTQDAPAVTELPDRSPTDSPFGQYVIEHIKSLCEGGSSLADAVRYAFHNKYLPYPLRQDDVCKEVLQRYQADILSLADSFKSLESAHLADAKLLVGFAWFAVVYDCYQYVEAYGELP